MKHQLKVKQTQQYSDSQGEHIVHKGKLLLLDRLNLPVYPKQGDLAKNPSTNELYVCNGNFLAGTAMFPIIISETEEITKEDVITDGEDLFEWDVELDRFLKVYSKGINKGLRTYVELLEAKETAFYKILALPEHFSDKHLQAIVDGKMKDRDEVLINCVVQRYKGTNIYLIGLNQQNHITLFPAKQSLEEASKAYYKQHVYNYLEAKNPNDTLEEMSLSELRLEIKCAIKFGAEWAKKNNY